MSDHETPSPETAAPLESVEAAGPVAPSPEATAAPSDATQPSAPSDAKQPSDDSQPSDAQPSDAQPSDAQPSDAPPSDAHVEDEHERSSAGARAPEPEEHLPARGEDPRPFIILTAIHDSNARVAAITLSHADAWERAQKALVGRDVAGVDIVELPIPPRAFAALREHIRRSPDTIAVYDLFPLAAHLGRAQRKVAGQFLAAEILWALEEQGILSGIPLNLRLDVPRNWGDRSPKAVHEKLVEAGALDLTEAAIEDFRAIKAVWDQG